ncbi:hypothetical protein H2200_003181 [Cladophialophora chaetospira]|uniref:Heterokaryon incompatibility domain-containing protein n=1 Tax=Cladophialophora chaetospira TaxID=386627 RepID=A0AA38XHR1_9EURO|nr:hypothetical protein H2200_003181 [Cladophialophora chaetospira]
MSSPQVDATGGAEDTTACSPPPPPEVEGGPEDANTYPPQPPSPQVEGGVEDTTTYPPFWLPPPPPSPPHLWRRAERGPGSTIYSRCEANEFRLLELHGGEHNRPLRGTLRTYPLNESPFYSAVSYKWGEFQAMKNELLDEPQHEPLEVITINDVKVYFERRNLVDMLRDLRDIDATRLLWIDVICINQDDVLERNAQVGNMASIYSQADCVVIWLSHRWMQRLLFRHMSKVVEQLTFEAWDDAYQEELVDLYRHEYWTRTWIIQEVTLARRVEIQNGDACLPLGLLARFGEICRSKLEGRVFEEESPPEKLFAERQARVETSYSTELAQILSKYKHFKCTDPRDQVYALLFLHQKAKEYVGVDYNASGLSLLLKVIGFSTRFENLPARALVQFGLFLKRQLKLTKSELRTEIDTWLQSNNRHDPLHGLNVEIYWRGRTNVSISAQEEVPVYGGRLYAGSLVEYPALYLRYNTRDDAYHASDKQEEVTKPHAPRRFSSRDLCVFGIRSSNIDLEHSNEHTCSSIGLAAMRVTNNLEVWQFVNTTIAFLSKSDDDDFRLVGRSYLMSGAVYDQDKSFKWDTLHVKPEVRKDSTTLNTVRKIVLTTPLYLSLLLWAEEDVEVLISGHSLRNERTYARR